MKKIKTALISVSDKKNLKPLLTSLKKNNIKIISSGGTYKEIKKLKFQCLEVSEFTDSPEILEGRVKTLHPKIHAGILNKRNNKVHLKNLKDNNFENIDLVVVNFYPFEETLKNTNNHNKIIENIDVGGPTMVRSAAKNYQDVTVITSSNQYEELIDELRENIGSTSLRFREKLSRIAFTETAYYDSVISDYFNKKNNIIFPKKKVFHTNLIATPRYGENPHQESGIYSKNSSLNLNQIHGKQLSYNNYNDIFSALTISKSLPKNIGTVIVKHANPCGVSINTNPLISYKSALACDPISAFGGIVSCNFKIKKNLASELNKLFLEVIIANGFDKDALKLLKKKKNLRLIDATNYSFKEILRFVSSNEELLIQTEDLKKFSKKDFKIVSKKKPTSKQMKDLIFAFNICRYVKSNAIVLAANGATAGIGSGQPSRLDSCQIAINKMNKFMNTNNEIVAASDAFFPFVDGIEKLVQSGVTAVIQPSGSIRDKEIIKFANETGTILVFSRTRHFRH
ncbi:bifunctional phosphoribosylaminoimidazolecarboxamide formyltransferase/IMP cyclohydrolase [uncultured Candidatus Pelagibacter sp.]|jgi:phosphoribosylaminoimidazolecarboxamide formyltransferase/IMP cyclohydrolase|uniref:bifunctional phosphoribosylaminoimidazolecarboxamide formyltransferase/IMP cyclohydrolase n=1 Tax=uncultured Candidatus Pelagibacter sp. TaxID=372654 RepID=UPI002333F6DE|nr:bifunctional phosphoribosylaminoimidazolecarboxamide formyltransferase/IMP cyclohydrolase [uncultured Candidatus Pelagibacter sp.]MDB3970100.1 bifunctional phosphoribosylaminoimidazolecarboxamide formyltransferase/IMP cyclohydrolase [Candidatus Pelagibacter sp.]